MLLAEVLEVLELVVLALLDTVGAPDGAEPDGAEPVGAVPVIPDGAEPVGTVPVGAVPVGAVLDALMVLLLVDDAEVLETEVTFFALASIQDSMAEIWLELPPPAPIPPPARKYFTFPSLTKVLNLANVIDGSEPENPPSVITALPD